MNENNTSPSGQLFRLLRAEGLDFFVTVPCKLLSNLIALVEQDTEIIYTPVTREEEGLGILAGAYLGGKRPVIAMQNSGLGNSMNVICSLLNYYRIPVVFIISHRGTAGEKIDAQKPMGEATKGLLEAANLPYYEISSADMLPLMKGGIQEAYRQQRSVAFLFPISFWEG